MGRRKKTDTNKTINTIKIEIYGIIVVALSLLFGVSIYFRTSGVAEKWLRYLFMGSMGIGAYVFPIISLFIGLALLISRDHLKIRQRFWGICLILCNLLLILNVGYSYSNSKLGFAERIVNAFELGLKAKGGGILCELIEIPLIYIFGRVGTYIILACATLIFIVMSTEISIGNLLCKSFDRIKERFKKTSDSKVKEPIIKEPKLIAVEEKEKKNAEEDIEKIDKKIKILDFLKNEQVLDDDKKEEKEIKPQEQKQETKNVSSVKKQEANNEISNEINTKSKEFKEIEYVYPSIDLLMGNKAKSNPQDKKELLNTARILEDTLQSFGVDAKVVQVSRGPAVTRYELHPSPGVKVSRITNLSDDIALNLAAPSVRIEAPIPGKAAVGIEVPNKEVVAVTLREVVESQEFNDFSSRLAFAMGKDIGGKCIVTDLSKMPHLLIAGATGSGKSVCINTLITSLMYKSSPKDVKMLLIDPKVVELSVYNGIPHLLIPVVTDPKKAASALYWAVNEMSQRYKLFADNNVRNIESYNKLMNTKEDGEKLPQIVIIIDELADLMMVAPNDVEDAICRLAQMARAAGMHLVIATQRPSVDVITGVIKANIPSRISFAVSSQIDSRTILDMSGAEKLLGKGDMLFLPIGENKPIRIQGAFISEKEVEEVVKFLKGSVNAEYSNEIIDEIENNTPSTQKGNDEVDELLPEAINIAVDYGQVSASMLQRRLRIGFNRASRIVEEMELRGIVGPQDGSKPRQILISKEDLDGDI